MLLGEGIFAWNAFNTLYNGMSPYNAYTGRQPQMLPDFDAPDLPEAETTGQYRERRVREMAISAIIQATAVAKVNRALRTETQADGGRLFKIGDLTDYHRPTTTKDDKGGWNGPCPVTALHLERGQLICQNGNRPITVQSPDARLTHYLEVCITTKRGSDNTAMRTILTHVAEVIAPGQARVAFGYEPDHNGNWKLSQGSKEAPKVHHSHLLPH